MNDAFLEQDNSEVTMKLPERIRFIAIDGVIGAGKTSLSKILAKALGANLVLEQFDENPFLPKNTSALFGGTLLASLSSEIATERIGEIFAKAALSPRLFLSTEK